MKRCYKYGLKVSAGVLVSLGKSIALCLYSTELRSTFIQSAAERRARHRACPDQSKSVSKIVKKVNKIGPKSRSKNGPKSSPKWSQMQPCWLQKRGPEGYPIGFWGSFSKFLPSWRSWSLWAGVEARFARLLGGKGGQHGSKLASKIEPTSMKNLSKNRSKI